MSPQKVVFRSDRYHDVVAAGVLERFALAEGWGPTLPVPIERIVETVYQLTILCEPLDEPPGEEILGVLRPSVRQIVLNEAHLDLFDSVIGPERFTLAHELGHWIYDADNPEQGSLFAGLDDRSVFCRRPGDSESDPREVNANKFAARLLLPEALVRAAITEPFRSWSAVASAANQWGSSKQALCIRLTDLKLDGFLP